MHIQFLLITHKIYKSFDCSYEVRGVFLHASKAFDMVWHDGVTFTLEQTGILENVPDNLQNVTDNQKQRAILNRQVFSLGLHKEFLRINSRSIALSRLY